MPCRIDLHRTIATIGNKYAVYERHSDDAMVLPIAVASADFRCHVIHPAVACINARVPPSGKSIAASHDIDQIERLGRQFGNGVYELGMFGCGNGHTFVPALAAFHPHRLVRVENPGVGVCFAVDRGRSHLNRSTEDMRRSGSLSVHFHAELRAQVGNQSGGRADGKGFLIDDF